MKRTNKRFPEKCSGMFVLGKKQKPGFFFQPPLFTSFFLPFLIFPQHANVKTQKQHERLARKHPCIFLYSSVWSPLSTFKQSKFRGCFCRPRRPPPYFRGYSLHPLRLKLYLLGKFSQKSKAGQDLPVQGVGTSAASQNGLCLEVVGDIIGLHSLQSSII